MAFSRITLDGTRLTKDNFKTPPPQMGILPFWFWNGELDEEELEWQLRQYKDRGIHGLFIHGRFGLKVPYLSDRWFERVKFVVEKAKEIEIDIWVYDEMNWPSGTAERQVLKKYPRLRQKYLELVVLNVDGPLFTFLEATDSRYVNTGNSKPIAAFACSEEEFEHGITNLIDLTPNLSFNQVIPWEAPAGKWKLLYFLEKEIDYYIDTLNPESTKRFIELTHEKYKQAVGRDFTTIVPGFYTDEPAMYYYQVGVDNYVIPWTSQMFKIFRQRRGYNLKPYLPALYANYGRDTARIRYDFWRTLTEQYAETYYKRIRDWCDDNDLIFTGHLLFEEWLRGHARCEGNIFKYLKHMHLIGVDHLYPKIGSAEEPGEHVSLKMASSAAHHFGSTRLLCESMGGTYWDCTLERMKWIANWEYVLGVNLFNNHGYHYSIEGERKRDWPPSQFYHHTWWKYYDRFTTYMSRLGHVLSGGRHVAKILILYPINSVWANYTPQSRSKIGDAIEFDYYYLTDTLLRMHYDFDFVDEDVLNDAVFKDGKIKIADEEYEVLLLPPITHLKKATFDSIEKFAQCGGSIIADTLLPVELLESDNDGSNDRIEQLFGVSPQEVMTEFSNGADFKVTHRNSSGNVFVIHGKGLHAHRRQSELKEVLDQCIVPDVIIDNEAIFYLHRVKDEYDVYFLVNTLQNDQGSVELSFDQSRLPELWDPNSGEIRPIYPFKLVDGRVKISLDFPATESRIVMFRNEITSPYVTESNLHIESIDNQRVHGYADVHNAAIFVKANIGHGEVQMTAEQKSILPKLSLGNRFNFELADDNVLCLAHWKMIQEDSKMRKQGPVQIDFDDSGWLDVTMGAWEMQLLQERDEETYPVALWYRTSFDMKYIPTSTRLLIDGFSGSSYALYVNGSPVDRTGVRSNLDAEIREADIQPFVRQGKNVVAVRLVVNRRTDGILDLLKIIGKFSLTQAGDAYVISEPKIAIAIGDWTKQGYPFFSGTGIYTTEINIPKDYLDGKLFLEVDCGEDVLELKVNDSLSHITPWHPYRIDVSDDVKAGNNRFQLKVTNTLINILEAVPKKSGLLSEPNLVHLPRYELNLKPE